MSIPVRGLAKMVRAATRRARTSVILLGTCLLILLGVTRARAGDDQATCATALTPPPAALPVTKGMLEAARGARRGARLLSTFDIVLVPGAGLAANPAALAAFERAAAQWEARFSDPITVTINADFADLGNPSIIGQSSSVLLQGPFDLIRDQMVADADADDAIVASLPSAADFAASMPAGFSLSGNVIGSKASLKAVGFAGLDDDFGVSDATITFNDIFAFDLDASDGVDPGTIDLETVAAHEIGHALGFLSYVDGIDGSIGGVVSPTMLDLFRFAERGANPSTAARFTKSARSAIPGKAEVFDDVESESPLSTGVFGGDGRQASHWKDDVLTGSFIGLMDPTLASATIEPITPADQRALDVIGYDVVPVSACGAAPELAASCFLQNDPLAASLAIADRPADARDEIQWSWAKGAATTLLDFLDPSRAETQFELCVYDGSANVQPLQAALVKGGGKCGTRPCWRALGATGYAYSRSATIGVGDGITQVKLKAGASGRAQVTVKGKGANLTPPNPALTPPVTVQLIARDGSATRCWQTTFTGSVSRNDDQQFKARGP
jgi:hypothetical protein